ncbi:hypothetical protein DL765_003578 [Monosporascus sp. GIB2]|nr:hypothetical protein DL765_003578 [Monosporascus sp. GIB2]
MRQGIAARHDYWALHTSAWLKGTETPSPHSSRQATGMSSPSTPTPTPTQGAQQHGGCVPEPPGNEELAPWVEAAAPAPGEFQWKAAAPGDIRSRGDAREAKEHGQEGT